MLNVFSYIICLKYQVTVINTYLSLLCLHETAQLSLLIWKIILEQFQVPKKPFVSLTFGLQLLSLVLYNLHILLQHTNLSHFNRLQFPSTELYDGRSPLIIWVILIMAVGVNTSHHRQTLPERRGQ